jgi:hypothetical protein
MRARLRCIRSGNTYIKRRNRRLWTGDIYPGVTECIPDTLEVSWLRGECLVMAGDAEEMAVAWCWSGEVGVVWPWQWRCWVGGVSGTNALHCWSCGPRVLFLSYRRGKRWLLVLLDYTPFNHHISQIQSYLITQKQFLKLSDVGRGRLEKLVFQQDQGKWHAVRGVSGRQLF